MGREKRETPIATGDKNMFELILKYWVEGEDLWIEATVYPRGQNSVIDQHMAEISLIFSDSH